MIRNTTDRSIGVAAFGKTEGLSNSQELRKKQDEKIQNKISRIEAQIAKGEYGIDLKKTAERMAHNLLNIEPN